MSDAKYSSDFWDCFWADYPEVELDEEKKKDLNK